MGTNEDKALPEEPANPEPVAAAAAPDAPKRSKIIKRYSNRKLYDTERSRYVTLDEIAQMIKAGEDVTIIDNKSKGDLTSVTLTQIIFEEEKRQSRMPLGMLRNLIQTGEGALQEFFDRQIKPPVEELQDKAQKSVEELQHRATSFREEVAKNISELTDKARTEVTRSVSELTDKARAVFQRAEESEKRTEEALRFCETTLDELKKRLEAEATALETDHKSGAPIADRLRPRLAELEALVSKIGAVEARAEDQTLPPAPPAATP